MRFIAFKRRQGADRYRLGILQTDDSIVDFTSLVADHDLRQGEVLGCYDLDSGLLDRIHAGLPELPVVGLHSVHLSSPIPRPGKVICIGLNYRDHAAESGMPIPASPVIFSKFGTCVIGSGDAIKIPVGSDQVDYEAELAVIIGRIAKNISADIAMDYVFGYTNFNDVSARDFQFADGQWQRGKSCDSFAPMGPFVTTVDEVPDPHMLNIRFRLNGDTLQDSSTSQLIFKIPELIEFISRMITLEPGDVIATGTPPGVGFARKPPIFMKPGDTAEVEIDGLGTLSNPVL